MKCAIRWVLFLGILGLFPLFGSAGQTSVEGVTLETMVKRSDRIVLVAVADPPSEQRVIRIKGRSVKTKEQAPPLKYGVDLYEVVEVLHGDPLEGPIEVVPADLSTKLTVHERYHLEGVSKSPIVQRYKPGREVVPDDNGQLIVFLGEHPEYGLQYAVGGGRESTANLDTVKALIPEAGNAKP